MSSFNSLTQRFPNCGSQTKSGSRSSVKWGAIAFVEIIILFRHLFVSSKNSCYKQRSNIIYFPIFKGCLYINIFPCRYSKQILVQRYLIQWVSSWPRYLQVGPDSDQFGDHCSNRASCPHVVIGVLYAEMFVIFAALVARSWRACRLGGPFEIGRRHY